MLKILEEIKCRSYRNTIEQSVLLWNVKKDLIKEMILEFILGKDAEQKQSEIVQWLIRRAISSLTWLDD